MCWERTMTYLFPGMKYASKTTLSTEVYLNVLFLGTWFDTANRQHQTLQLAQYGQTDNILLVFAKPRQPDTPIILSDIILQTNCHSSRVHCWHNVLHLEAMNKLHYKGTSDVT